MTALPVSSQSDWQTGEIENFLKTTTCPMRLAVKDTDDFPMICSLWHHYEGGKILAVTHKDSKLLGKLRLKPQCAFEIANNTPPYKGVRGQATCHISEEAEKYLPLLMSHFLADKYHGLKAFLSNRIHEERLLTLHLHTITAWDFSGRMQE